MSVILIDMDMPNSCYECRLKNRCEYALANGWLGNKRDENCPLRPYKERKMEWIPVTERLPDKEGDYLTTKINDFGELILGMTYYRKEWGWSTSYKITAWMPLPKPYEGSETE